MAIETASNISQLNIAGPADDEYVTEGAGHLRLIKSTLKTTFPKVTGVVDATHQELSAVGANATRLTAVEGNRARRDVAETFAENVTFTKDIAVGGVVRQAGAPLIPRGVIVMWSGTVANVPAGWVLCDGTNGTPNLRDRFILGAGALAAHATVGTHAQEVDTWDGGALNVSQRTGEGHANFSGWTEDSDPLYGWTGSAIIEKRHLPRLDLPTANSRAVMSDASGTGQGMFGGGTPSNSAMPTTVVLDGGGEPFSVPMTTPAHGHRMNFSAPHDHPMTINVPPHKHRVTFDNRPASYVLAFIMKT